MSDGASGDNQAGPGVPAGAMSRELLIVNKRGLHARASAKFVQLVERFNAEVWVTRGGETVGGTSIMGLMMLAAGPGTTITVAAAGPEAEAALAAADEKTKATAKDFTDASQKFEAARRTIEPLRAALGAAEAKQQNAMKAFEAYMSGADEGKPGAAADTVGDRESELEDALLDLTIEADKARADAAAQEMSFAEVQAAYSAAQNARDSAMDVFKDAQTDLASAQATLTDANREMRLRGKPIAVLVSLRTQRIYIRQGFEPLLEAPINVAPLKHKVGTHVFTAMRYGSDPNSFDWRLVSAQTPIAGQPLDQGKKMRRTASAQGQSLDVQMATEALDAFTIPDDILQTISELARPGSSMIVSDRELPAHENGSGTEFVVLTR